MGSGGRVGVDVGIGLAVGIPVAVGISVGGAGLSPEQPIKNTMIALTMAALMSVTIKPSLLRGDYGTGWWAYGNYFHDGTIGQRLAHALPCVHSPYFSISLPPRVRASRHRRIFRPEVTGGQSSILVQYIWDRRGETEFEW